MWNNKFGSENYLYGTNPNKFLVETLEKLTPGRILFVGEGEGRNAVYAAKLGWQTDAIDYSEVGKEKADKLAAQNGVTINYSVMDLKEFSPDPETYDVVVNIFVHLPNGLRNEVHQKLVHSLKPGGKFILEAFDIEQLKFNSGGPKDEELLYTLDILIEDFIDLEFEKLEKLTINLDEGPGHKGEAMVLRFIGKKP